MLITEMSCVKVTFSLSLPPHVYQVGLKLLHAFQNYGGINTHTHKHVKVNFSILRFYRKNSGKINTNFSTFFYETYQNNNNKKTAKLLNG